MPHLLRNSAGLMWSSAAYANGRRSASRIITIVSATEVLGQPNGTLQGEQSAVQRDSDERCVCDRPDSRPAVVRGALAHSS